MVVATEKPTLSADRLASLVAREFGIPGDQALDRVIDLLQEQINDPWRTVSRYRVSSFAVNETKRKTKFVVKYLTPDMRPGEDAPHWVPHAESREDQPAPALFEALEDCIDLYLAACQFDDSERETIVLTKVNFSRLDDEAETLGIRLGGIKNLVGEGEKVGEKLPMALSPVRYVAPPGGGDDLSKVMDQRSVQRVERLHREILRYLMGETAQLSLGLA